MRRQRSLLFAVIGALVALLMVGSSVAAVTTAGVKIGETNDKYNFRPLTAYVNIGGTVTWTNGSDAAHTVTSDAGSELASSTFGAGKTFKHTFATTGTFAYHCSIHTYMVGKVVVLAAGVTPPPTDTLSPALPESRVPGEVALLVLVGLGGGLVALRRFQSAHRG
jgi:plastocyanin